MYDPTNSQFSIPNADLVSAELSSKNTTDCFQFYYYIYDMSFVSVLELFVIDSADNHQSIWKRQHSAGDMWHSYNINIGPQKTTYKVSHKQGWEIPFIPLKKLS